MSLVRDLEWLKRALKESKELVKLAEKVDPRKARDVAWTLREAEHALQHLEDEIEAM